MKIKENIKLALIFTVMPFGLRFLFKGLPVWVACIFFTVAILNLLFPKFSEFLMKVGKFIGRYIAAGTLAVVYILAVLPTGLLMKIVKRDRLKLKKPVAQSYWLDYGNKSTDYEYQF